MPKEEVKTVLPGIFQINSLKTSLQMKIDRALEEYSVEDLSLAFFEDIFEKYPMVWGVKFGLERMYSQDMTMYQFTYTGITVSSGVISEGELEPRFAAADYIERALAQISRETRFPKVTKQPLGGNKPIYTLGNQKMADRYPNWTTEIARSLGQDLRPFDSFFGQNEGELREYYNPARHTYYRTGEYEVVTLTYPKPGEEDGQAADNDF